MNSFHDVSIIIVAMKEDYNLERCIRSCVAQTYPGRSFEVLILHNGTSLVVEDIAANYGKSRPMSCHLTEDTPAAILATALRISTGRFIVFVDPNDFISDFMILFQTVFLYDNPSFATVATDYWTVDPDSDRKMARIVAQDAPILGGLMFRKDLLVKLMRSEGPALGYAPETLCAILMRNGRTGSLPISFYRRTVKLGAADSNPEATPR